MVLWAKAEHDQSISRNIYLIGPHISRFTIGICHNNQQYSSDNNVQHHDQSVKKVVREVRTSDREGDH